MTIQFGAGERLQWLQSNGDDKLNKIERQQVKTRPAGLQLAGGASLEFGLRIVKSAVRSLGWALVQLLAKLFEPTKVQRVNDDRREQTRSSFSTTSPSGDCSQIRLDSRETKRTQRRAPQRDVQSQTEASNEPTKPKQIPPVQMSQEIVAGFEEQQVAHELSAQVVEEALQAITGQLKMSLPEPTEADRPEDEKKDNEQTRRSSNDELQLEVDKSKQLVEPEVDDSLDGSLEALSDGLDNETDEHCGRQASQINLRQLRMSALEDMLVCDQRRHNTNAARHLFNQLANQASVNQDQYLKPAFCGNGKNPGVLKQKGSSLSSRSGDNNSDDENNSSVSNRLDIGSLDELLGDCQSNQTNDCGTIKLDRRCCSSSSSSVNFGRTLVCSVSPTGQFNLNTTNNNNNNHHKTLNIHEHNDGPNQQRDDDDLNYYPINGDEIRQCRAAFRENRRLIEQAQSEAYIRHRNTTNGGGLNRSASQATMRPDRAVQDRTRWADSLGRRSRLPECSRCQQKLYPVDKMDLDFTRATLNIHRNCFKCQVCATLLRLETYASIDTKLYCPAHVKCVMPSR